jgi:hypothetical protein
MSDRIRQVLLVSPDKERDGELFKRLAPILTGFSCEVHRFPQGADIFAMVEKTAFDLLIVGFPIEQPMLPALLKSIRWRNSACRRTAVMVISTSIARRRAEQYLNRGVNRLVDDDASDWELEAALSELLEVEPRVYFSLLVKLQILTNGKPESIMAQIDNLSSSGMLVRGQWDVGICDPVGFEFTLPGQHDPISGTAEVVRPTTKEREGLTGFAARFVKFEGGGREQLERFVSRQRLPTTAL